MSDSMKKKKNQNTKTQTNAHKIIINKNDDKMFRNIK